MANKHNSHNEKNLATAVDDGLLYLGASDVAIPSDVLPPIMVGPTFINLSKGSPNAGWNSLTKTGDSLLFGGENKKERFVVAYGRSIEATRKLRMRNWTGKHSVSRESVEVHICPIMHSGKSRSKNSVWMWCEKTKTWELLHGTTTAISTGQHKCHDGDSAYTKFVLSESMYPSFLSKAAYLRSSCWSVVLRLPGSHGLTYLTDSTGVKGFFQLRDKPEGMSRRAALLHWVRAHSRVDRRDPEADIAVRGHLRGRDTFDWFGMHGSVHSPSTDRN